MVLFLASPCASAFIVCSTIYRVKARLIRIVRRSLVSCLSASALAQHPRQVTGAATVCTVGSHVCLADIGLGLVVTGNFPSCPTLGSGYFQSIVYKSKLRGAATVAAEWQFWGRL